MNWCDQYQAQIVVLAAQIMCSENVEGALQVIANAGDDNLQGEEISLIYRPLIRSGYHTNKWKNFENAERST